MTVRTAPWPAGTPCWIDLVTTDADAAQRFYTELFGWEWSAETLAGVDYRTATLDGHAVCGLLQPPDDHPAVWNTYFATDDLERTAAAIAVADGQILDPITQAGERGRFLVAKDATGAVFSCWEAAAHVGCEITNEPGTLVWNELVTRDYDGAKAFYTSVFGHATSEIGDSDHPIALLQLDGHEVANIEPMPPSLPPSVPPHWRLYFACADVDATGKRAVDAGGSVRVEPHDTPFGRWATLLDPQGGFFGVIAPAE